MNHRPRDLAADLGGILATVRTTLNGSGFSIMQALGNADDGRPPITTTLLHEGGQGVCQARQSGESRHGGKEGAHDGPFL